MKPAQAVPATYDGREQAYVKHVLLESYLETLVMIIGQSGGARKRGEVEITFVDCFAGPWQSDDAELSGTSISLSLRILAACKAKLARKGIATKMRALYVEKHPEAFSRLDAFLGRQDQQVVETACLEGDFLDLRQAILDWCGTKAFCFFFIDPKGFKEIGVTQLSPLLKRRRSEFLINFMYMFVNRVASMEEQKSVMRQLLGGEVDLTGLDPDERERRILSLYRAGLLGEMREACGADFPPRSAYARVLDVSKARVKYHLVYATSHPLGIVRFMEASEGAEQVQQTVRDYVHFESREQAALIQDMFAEEERVPQAAARAAAEEIDRFWLRYLKDEGRRVDLGAFASILEAQDFFPGELQASLGGLICRNMVVNEDAKRKRTMHHLHYEDAERLHITPAGLAELVRLER